MSSLPGTPDSFRVVTDRLALYPDLAEVLSVTKLCMFFMQISRLKNDILLTLKATVSHTDVPEFLPPSILAFLAESLDLSSLCIEQCWALFRDLAWTDTAAWMQHDRPLRAFFIHGLDKVLGMNFFIYSITIQYINEF